MEKVAGEALLIAASVFLAISLESMWQERSDAAEARVALAQLLQELRADHAFLAVVSAEQEMTGRVHLDLVNWLSNPESLPTELVHQAFQKWNQWYLTYMTDDYGKDLSTLIYEVEQYLSAHGIAIE